MIQERRGERVSWSWKNKRAAESGSRVIVHMDTASVCSYVSAAACPLLVAFSNLSCLLLQVLHFPGGFLPEP